MARTPKPWHWKARKGWYVILDGKKIRLGNTKKEATEEFYKRMSEPQQPVIRSDSVLSILDLFLDWTERHRNPETFMFYRDHLQPFAKSIPVSLTVSQLKPFHVQEWVDSHENWAPGTIRNGIRAVQRAMKWAAEQGYIDRSPIACMEKPKGGTRDLVISLIEYNRILSKITDSFRDLVEFSWETGARCEESIIIEACHVQDGRIVLPISEERWNAHQG